MIEEYINAQKRAEKEYKTKLARGEYPYLPALDEIIPDADRRVQHSLGLIEIPVDQIVGTKTRARQNSFSSNFLPILKADTEFAIKWSELYNAQLDEGFRHPIKVYEYLHKFYVIEGNKRVSISRYLDMHSITAEVTRIMPTDEEMADNPAYAQFLGFYQRCPIFDVTCGNPESYQVIESVFTVGDSVDRNSLQTAYWRFQRAIKSSKNIFPKNMADESANNIGDAFAVFLKIYGKKGISNGTDQSIEAKVRKIRNEILTACNSDKISLIESSEEAMSAGGIASGILNKVLPAMPNSKSYSKKNPLKAAWIYEKSAKESVWTYNHDSGRHRLEDAYKGVVKTRYFRNKNTSVAIERAVAWGADVVFTISPTQMEAALHGAMMHEDVKFLNCSINLAYQSVRTYYAKLYEAKFLAGAAAAIASDNHKIGYCVDDPVYGTIASVNAFAIGAAMIDPEAKIYLHLSNTPGNDWLEHMKTQDIRIISAIDSTYSVNGDNAVGVFRVEDDGSITNLVAPIWKWGKMYDIIIKTILDGTYNARLVAQKDRATNYCWGMISGVVDLKISENVPAYARHLLETLRHDVISGELNPFDWVICDQNGKLRNGPNETLTSMDIITMDWLVENVIGEIDEDTSNRRF